MIDLKLLNESEPIELKLEKNLSVGGISDVKINGASIVKDGVADIPIANIVNTLGLVKYKNGYGIKVNEDGMLALESAQVTHIDRRFAGAYPIVAEKLDYAVKMAMTDGKGAEWTQGEKASARARMGFEWKYIDCIEVSDVSQVDITFPQGYDEFMVIADIKGSGTDIIYPDGGYTSEDGVLRNSTLIFTDFYPNTNDEHYELVFEKMNIENETYLRMSGFQSKEYAKKLKQNIQTTGWLQHYNTTNTYPCHTWYGVRFTRTITSATFKLFAR